MAITMREHREGSSTVVFAGHPVDVTITSYGEHVFNWVRGVHRRHPGYCGLVVGLAIKQRPVLPSSADQRTIALLQLSVDQQCLIFQIAHADWIPYFLRRFLDSHTCCFVSMDAAAVADRLRDEYGLVVRKAVDLAELAAEKTGLANLRQAHICALAWVVAGLNVRAGSCLRTWDQRPLSRNQTVRACAEAFLASEVGSRLLRR